MIYVPILKFRDAEKNVLKHLPEEILEQVYPLLESVPRERSRKVDKKYTYTPVDQRQTLQKDLAYIDKNLAHVSVFFDSFNLDKTARKELFQLLEHPTNLFGNKITPVVYLKDCDDLTSIKDIFEKAVNKRGVCLRIQPKDEPTDTLIKEVSTFIKKLQLNTQSVNLLIDYQSTHSYTDAFVKLLPELQNIGTWKSIVLASGAAPQYLSDFSLEEVGEAPRWDWEEWNKVKDILKTDQIGYGDYGVRYPVFELLRNPNPSNSIRYTGDEHWLIFRGKSPKARGYQGTKQYRAHAMLLISNKQYSGKQFSSGDNYMHSMANLDEADIEKNGSGNSTTWLQASTDHHIHKVIYQLNNV